MWFRLVGWKESVKTEVAVSMLASGLQDRGFEPG
jgi:hypothetical protein